MELSTITMEPEAARESFEEYAAAVRAEHGEEDRAIAEGYKALSEGKQLLELSKTLAAGGTTAVTVRSPWREPLITTVPRLAYCRADAKLAFTHGVDSQGGCLITADRRDGELHTHNRRDRFPMPAGTFEPDRSPSPMVRAIVPTIPPRFRPKRGLQRYVVLWEAEWAADPPPPGDPALLRRLGGDLYIVLATWDLSPLEQAVLSGRA